MRRPKLLHPVTADHRRELSVAALAKAGAFKGPGMRFPFQHLDVTAPDHVRVFRVGDKSRQSPQIVHIDWREMPFRSARIFSLPALPRTAQFSLSRAFIHT